VLRNPPERKARNRYLQCYSDRSKLKLTDMKRTFFKNKLDGLTALSDSQRNEVLFFATAHFLFFNFFANRTKHTFIFFATLQAQHIKKCKSVFSNALSSQHESISHKDT
jgi:hypothetical protein